MKKIYLTLFAAGIISALFFVSISERSPRSNPPAGSSRVRYNLSVKSAYNQPIKVLRVIDGDTVELLNGDRLRYIGIDTPEEFDPRKPVQCFAKEAAERNKELVEGKDITFLKDVSDRDKYGRMLGLVYLADGTFVNKTLVAEGYAFAYPYWPDITYAEIFKTAELAAYNQHLGLWAKCRVLKLSTGREQTNAVQ